MSTLREPSTLIDCLTTVRDVLLRPDEPPVRQLRTTYVLFGFDIDQAALQPDHVESLDALRGYLDEHPEASVTVIKGRASQTGPEANNDALAFDRAETVRAHLLATGLPDSQIGPTVAGGAGDPIIDVPGREAELNRSVEIETEWYHVPEPTPPAPPPPTGSTTWQLTLTLTIGVGSSWGGQTQFGTLTKLRPGMPSETRDVSVLLFGLGLGVGDPAIASVGVGAPLSPDGIITFRTPVDWDWFEHQPIAMVTLGVQSVVMGSASLIVFIDPSQDTPIWTSVDIGAGAGQAAGGQALVGVLTTLE